MLFSWNPLLGAGCEEVGCAPEERKEVRMNVQIERERERKREREADEASETVLPPEGSHA